MNEEGNLKKCPFCAEEINIEAIKCKYCGSMLNNVQVSQDNSNKIRVARTLTFEVTESGQRAMAAKLSEMENDGWKEVSRASKTGKYKGSQGCCLFLIFAPLALLAGHDTDKVIVTLEKYMSEEEMLVEKAALKKKQKKANRVIYWSIGLVIFFITMASMAATSQEQKVVAPQSLTPEQIAAQNAQIEAQKKAAAEQAIKDKAAEAAWAKTAAGQLCAKHPDWVKDECQRVTDRKIWVGMSLDMLKVEVGNPSSSNPSNYGGETQWQWCYDNLHPSCFYGGSDEIITSYN